MPKLGAGLLAGGSVVAMLMARGDGALPALTQRGARHWGDSGGRPSHSSLSQGREGSGASGPPYPARSLLQEDSAGGALQPALPLAQPWESGGG